MQKYYYHFEIGITMLQSINITLNYNGVVLICRLTLFTILTLTNPLCKMKLAGPVQIASS